MRILVVIFLILILLLTSFPVNAQSSTPVQCGDIIEDEITASFQPRYYSIELSAGDVLNLSAVPIGDTLRMILGLFAPNSEFIVAAGAGELAVLEPVRNPQLPTVTLSSNGTYQIVVYNGGIQPVNNGQLLTDTFWSGGIGVYTLYIGCTLRDGTVIEPGDTSQPVEAAPSDGGMVEPPEVDFAVRGFPGLAPRDFSQGIEIPLTAGQPQTAPVGSDVALYTYAAAAGEVATLSATRVSGDISLGITVINRDTNEIIFVGGMPYSDSLTATLNFPVEGTYAIGLFRLDTPTVSGTSGAVQISISP